MKSKEVLPAQNIAKPNKYKLSKGNLNNLFDKNGSLIFENGADSQNAQISFRTKTTNALVIGSGNTAYALACYLINQRHNVGMLMRDKTKIKSLADLTINATGLLNNSFKLSSLDSCPQKALIDIDTIFIATNTTAYGDVARQIAPYLNKNQNIILFSSKFGGVLEFTIFLNEFKANYNTIIETDALFPCRLTSDTNVNIKGIKNWTLYSAQNPNLTKAYKNIILNYFPSLDSAQNVVQRGLTDFGAFAHPLIMLLNINKIDQKESFAFYQCGLTPNTICLLEAENAEFMAVAKAYSTSIIPMAELLDRYYGCDSSSLYNALNSVSQYNNILSPVSLYHRFIEEDVASSLVPIYQLAQKAKLKTPVIESIINLASVLYNIDFKSTGRNLAKLGLDNLSYREIVNYLNE